MVNQRQTELEPDSSIEKRNNLPFSSKFGFSSSTSVRELKSLLNIPKQTIDET
jgi:hypothetical protein